MKSPNVSLLIGHRNPLSPPSLAIAMAQFIGEPPALATSSRVPSAPTGLLMRSIRLSPPTTNMMLSLPEPALPLLGGWPAFKPRQGLTCASTGGRLEPIIRPEAIRPRRAWGGQIGVSGDVHPPCQRTEPRCWRSPELAGARHGAGLLHRRRPALRLPL